MAEEWFAAILLVDRHFYLNKIKVSNQERACYNEENRTNKDGYKDETRINHF